MKSRNWLRAGFGAMLVLFALFLTAGVRAASFTADIAIGLEDQTIMGKIYVTADYYRMDIEQDGQELNIIADRQAGRTRVLVPAAKQYLEMKSDDPTSLMNDPFQSVIYTESFAEKENLGMETIEGYECEKFGLTYTDQKLMTVWKAVKLDFPIKIVNAVDTELFMNLTAIEVGPVDTAVFATPEDFTPMPAPGEEPVEVPEWAAEVASAPVLTPPFEQAMAAGDIIRVKVQPGKDIWVKATDQSGDDVSAKAVPFKDGVPIRNLDMYNNFAQHGVVCERRGETEAEADEIVIRVSKGGMTILGKYFPMQEAVVSAGDNYAYKIVSDDYINARFVNTSEVEAELILSFSEGGKELSEEAIGPERFRTLTIEAGQTARRTLNPAGDLFIVRVVNGSVLIKVGQFDSFTW